METMEATQAGRQKVESIEYRERLVRLCDFLYQVGKSADEIVNSLENDVALTLLDRGPESITQENVEAFDQFRDIDARGEIGKWLLQMLDILDMSEDDPMN